MLKLAIALVLAAHGVGHSMGILGAFKLATVNPAWQGDSWILGGPGASQTIGTALWALALGGFVMLGAVVAGWLPLAWWQPLAIGSSVASLLGLLLFPIAFPAFSTLGALAVDMAVIVAVAWYGWTPSDLTS